MLQGFPARCKSFDFCTRMKCHLPLLDHLRNFAPMQQEPLNENTPYDDVAAALLASERAISEVCFGHFKPNKLLTYADFFGMGIGRRALALSSGFRLMVEHRNSLCALPIVRMQLDTSLRLYAGFFVTASSEILPRRSPRQAGRPAKER